MPRTDVLVSSARSGSSGGAPISSSKTLTIGRAGEISVRTDGKEGVELELIGKIGETRERTSNTKSYAF